MPVDAFAASVRQEGRAVNEDAFGIVSGVSTVITLADGAGAAEQAARRAVRQFEAFLSVAAAEAIGAFPAWVTWLRALDAGMLGGAQSTFVSVAVIEDRIVGAVVGDSRAYLWTGDGDLRILTEGASKARLGSGHIQPSPIHAPFGRGDIVLLLSDGAWTPLPMSRLRDTIAGSALGPLAELPEAILREAGRTGAADDMTVVVARQR